MHTRPVLHKCAMADACFDAAGRAVGYMLGTGLAASGMGAGPGEGMMLLTFVARSSSLDLVAVLGAAVLLMLGLALAELRRR